MSGLVDLLFSYAMVGTGFVIFGTLLHAWVFPERIGGASVLGLLAATFVLGLLGGVIVVIGLNWHRTATDDRSAPGPRDL